MTTAVKTLMIRNFKGIPGIDDVFLEEQCNILKNSLDDILNGKRTNQTLQDLYCIVESVQPFRNSQLYENLHSLIETNLIQKVELLQNKKEIIHGLNNIWTSFCMYIKTVKNIFLCLDKSSKNKFNTVNIMSMNLFKTIVLLNPEIKRKLNNEIFYYIELERKGEEINMLMLQSVISMFTELKVYEDLFQTDFLKITESFYREEGNLLLNQYSVSEYLKYVGDRIAEEQERAKNYLSKYTGYATLEIVYKYLVKEHVVDILDKGFTSLMDNNDLDTLTLKYNLLKKVTTGTKYLLEYFTNYVLKEGSKIMNTLDNDKNMIQNLIAFKDKLDNIVNVSFKSNYNFWGVIRNTFVKFINVHKNKPAHLLAKYVDLKLRSKEVNDAELEKIFDKVMVIFRFIQGKDVFEAFYKRDLAKRLLLGKSTSQDAEDSMIAKLKNECGDNYTTKIEGMFKDMNISQSVNNSFKQHLKNSLGDACSIDLCINVLTNSFWPNYPNYEINMPPDIINYQLAFQKFYSFNHSGRKLIWQQNLAHCVVKANFDSGNKELQLSLFQTIVLLLFNTHSKLSFKEIQELTILDSNELKKTMLALACGKSRIVLKDSKGVDIQDDDMFSVNTQFSDKLFRIKINHIQLKDTVEEERVIESSVLIDRQFQIDAAIVRIMKKKMTVNHNELLADLFNILDIPVKPHDLKKRIELLIEREYMERDKDNPANYTYIA